MRDGRRGVHYDIATSILATLQRCQRWLVGTNRDRPQELEKLNLQLSELEMRAVEALRQGAQIRVTDDMDSQRCFVKLSVELYALAWSSDPPCLVGLDQITDLGVMAVTGEFRSWRDVRAHAPEEGLAALRRLVESDDVREDAPARVSRRLTSSSKELWAKVKKARASSVHRLLHNFDRDRTDATRPVTRSRAKSLHPAAIASQLQRLERACGSSAQSDAAQSSASDVPSSSGAVSGGVNRPSAPSDPATKRPDDEQPSAGSHSPPPPRALKRSMTSGDLRGSSRTLTSFSADKPPPQPLRPPPGSGSVGKASAPTPVQTRVAQSSGVGGAAGNTEVARQPGPSCSSMQRVSFGERAEEPPSLEGGHRESSASIGGARLSRASTAGQRRSRASRMSVRLSLSKKPPAFKPPTRSLEPIGHSARRLSVTQTTTGLWASRAATEVFWGSGHMHGRQVRRRGGVDDRKFVHRRMCEPLPSCQRPLHAGLAHSPRVDSTPRRRPAAWCHRYVCFSTPGQREPHRILFDLPDYSTLHGWIVGIEALMRFYMDVLECRLIRPSLMPWLRAVFTSACESERKAANGRRRQRPVAIAIGGRALPTVLAAANIAVAREEGALILSKVFEDHARKRGSRGSAVEGRGGPGGEMVDSSASLRPKGMLQMASLYAASVSFVDFQHVMSRVLLDERIGSLFRIHAAEARRLAKTTGGGRMTRAEWLKFQRVEQGEAESTMAAHERMFLSVTGLTPGLTQLQFQWLLLHETSNAAIDRGRLAAGVDNSKPLAHYFINTSHNTFLDGHQLSSNSQPDMYRRVMLEGCRSVEIDCWDNVQDGEPEVTHGHTLCTKCKFRAVVLALVETAFVVSDLPVFLSLEMHCSKAQQIKIANCLRDMLGDALLLPEEVERLTRQGTVRPAALLAAPSHPSAASPDAMRPTECLPSRGHALLLECPNPCAASPRPLCEQTLSPAYLRRRFIVKGKMASKQQQEAQAAAQAAEEAREGSSFTDKVRRQSFTRFRAVSNGASLIGNLRNSSQDATPDAATPLGGSTGASNATNGDHTTTAEGGSICHFPIISAAGAIGGGSSGGCASCSASVAASGGRKSPAVSSPNAGNGDDDSLHKRAAFRPPFGALNSAFSSQSRSQSPMTTRSEGSDAAGLDPSPALHTSFGSSPDTSFNAGARGLQARLNADTSFTTDKEEEDDDDDDDSGADEPDGSEHTAAGSSGAETLAAASQMAGQPGGERSSVGQRRSAHSRNPAENGALAGTDMGAESSGAVGVRRSSCMRRSITDSAQGALLLATKVTKKRRKKGRYVDPEMEAVTTARSRPVDFILQEGGMSKWPLPITSISEKELSELTHNEVFFEHLQRSLQLRMARAYPRGTRIDSSNMSPLSVWRAGVHMVALNYQTNDIGMQLNRAFFDRCGRSGYVPKPEGMLTSPPLWPPPRTIVHCATVRLLSLHQLPARKETRPLLNEPHYQWVTKLNDAQEPPQPSAISNPSLTLELFAIGGYCATTSVLPPPPPAACTTRMHTSAVAGNGLNPHFDLTAHCLAAEPRETILRISVQEGGGSSDGPHHYERDLAYEAVVLDALRPGYRCLPLRSNRLGTRIDMCSVLVHVSVSEVPLESAGNKKGHASHPSLSA